MHDLRFLRDNLDLVRGKLGARGGDVPWDELGKLLQERKTLTVKIEELRHQLKTGSTKFREWSWVLSGSHPSCWRYPRP